MSSPHSFELAAADGKMIRGDRSIGQDRQILFITGFLSKRWGNKSKALAQWCEDKGWGFCCYDVRGFGDSEGRFTDYTLSDWIADARLVLNMLREGPPISIVGNSLGSWIAWLMAQEFQEVERLILIAPAFNMMGVRARSISEERRHAWLTAGWMPWDDELAHKDWPLSWKWVEESAGYWKTSFDRLRPVKTTILHGLQDTVILPRGSSEFVEQLLSRDPAFPVELHLIPGDHRLSSHEQVERFRRLVLETP
jgi:pimeloyl-ACP methyl ester carboxylesterase